MIRRARDRSGEVAQYRVSDIEGESLGRQARAIEHDIALVGLRGFWSHGTARRAGVGIFVRQAFLDLFEQPPLWQEILPGRAAVLRLAGSRGMLDLVTVYFPTGSQAGLHSSASAPPSAASLRAHGEAEEAADLCRLAAMCGRDG